MATNIPEPYDIGDYEYTEVPLYPNLCDVSLVREAKPCASPMTINLVLDSGHGPRVTFIDGVRFFPEISQGGAQGQDLRFYVFRREGKKVRVHFKHLLTILSCLENNKDKVKGSIVAARKEKVQENVSAKEISS